MYSQRMASASGREKGIFAAARMTTGYEEGRGILRSAQNDKRLAGGVGLWFASRWFLAVQTCERDRALNSNPVKIATTNLPAKLRTKERKAISRYDRPSE